MCPQKRGKISAMAIATPAKIRFGTKKIPIKLVFGGPNKAHGQLTGLGVQTGTKSSMSDPRSLVRMDYHEPDSGHGGATGLKRNEINVFYDENFHYHVLKWAQ